MLAVVVCSVCALRAYILADFLEQIDESSFAFALNEIIENAKVIKRMGLLIYLVAVCMIRLTTRLLRVLCMGIFLRLPMRRLTKLRTAVFLRLVLHGRAVVTAVPVE